MGFRKFMLLKLLRKQAAGKVTADQNATATQRAPAPATDKQEGNSSTATQNTTAATAQTTNVPAEEKDGLEFYINSMRNRRKKGAPLIGISQFLGGNESLGV